MLTDKQREAVEAVQRCGSIRAAARAIGVDHSSVRERLKAAEAKIGPIDFGTFRDDQNESDAPESFERQEYGDAVSIVSRSAQIRTVEQALAKGGIDTALWYVDRSSVNSWEVATKAPDGTVTVTPLWQVKVWLKRRVPSVVAGAFDGLLEKMKGHHPKYQTLCRPESHGDVMLEISLPDVHFGKLCWGRETGTDYDVAIAGKRLRAAAFDIMARAQHFGVSCVTFPIGSDFFQVDNAQNTTAAGTAQDVDGRLSKIFEEGMEALVDIIDAALMLGPVDLYWVPGNHDKQVSWFAAKFLQAWYRDTAEVKVDCEPTPRKYVRHGHNLIGYAHGDSRYGEKIADLPLIMAQESPDYWQVAKWKEWHVGHVHKRRETRFLALDTHAGVSVRVLPSLSGIDSWHSEKGFVGNRAAADAFLWSAERGLIGTLTYNAEE